MTNAKGCAAYEYVARAVPRKGVKVKFEIKHRFSGAVLFALETESMKLCVEAAVNVRANLRGADLMGTNLRGANLRGADLRGTNLGGADLMCTNLRGADLWGADLGGTNLRGADLMGTNLRGANLRGADLGGADLRGTNLADPDGKKITAIGVRPLLTFSPLGSRADYLQAWLTDGGIYVRAGCFWDTLAKFKSAVKTTHGTTTVHAKEYALAIKLIEAHARMWKPKKEKAK